MTSHSPHSVQDRRKGVLAARIADVNVFSDVVRAFNAKQGVVPASGETPISAASHQPQQDSVAFLEHVIDALHEETRALRARLASEEDPGVGGGDDEDGWLQVRLDKPL